MQLHKADAGAGITRLQRSCRRHMPKRRDVGSNTSSSSAKAAVRCRGATTAAAAAAAAAPAQKQLPAVRQAWHITKQGDMSSLRLVMEPMPAFNKEEHHQQQCLVEVACLGLNLADVFCTLGLYKAAPKGDFVPGLEFSGVVLATSSGGDGDDASSSSSASAQQRFQPGDRVLGVVRFGAFASHVVLPAAYLRPVPDDWSYQQAAAYPVQTLTAAYGLFECGNLRQGQTVLVQSAAGGVGLQALQILRALDCSVLGLVGSEDKAQLLRDKFGSSSGNESSSSSSPPVEFAARVRGQQLIRQQLSGFLQRAGRGGFDVVLDSLAGEYFSPSYQSLSACGRHVVFGAGSLTPEAGRRLTLNPLALLASPADLLALLRLVAGWLARPRLDVTSMPGDNVGVVGFNLIYLYGQLGILAALYDRLDGLLLPPPLVGREFSFQELPEALAFLQSGKSVGKVVCAVRG